MHGSYHDGPHCVHTSNSPQGTHTAALQLALATPKVIGTRLHTRVLRFQTSSRKHPKAQVTVKTPSVSHVQGPSGRAGAVSAGPSLLGSGAESRLHPNQPAAAGSLNTPLYTLLLEKVYTCNLLGVYMPAETPSGHRPPNQSQLWDCLHFPPRRAHPQRLASCLGTSARM